MASRLTWHAGQIEYVERTTTSVNGNPAWFVYFKDGRARVRTQTDGSIGYEIGNPEWRQGWVRYAVTPAGRMVTVEHFDTSKVEGE